MTIGVLAHLDASPSSLALRNSAAALTVAVRIHSAGDRPQCSTRNTHSCAFSPWWFPGVPASVPIAIVHAQLVRRVGRRQVDVVERRHPLAQVLRASSPTTSGSRNSSSPAQIVGTERVPALGHRFSTASSANVQCSMLSAPASTAFSMPAQGVAVRGEVLVVVVGDLDRRPQLVERVLDRPSRPRSPTTAARRSPSP